jgi:hypothetical protein
MGRTGDGRNLARLIQNGKARIATIELALDVVASRRNLFSMCQIRRNLLYT